LQVFSHVFVGDIITDKLFEDGAFVKQQLLFDIELSTLEDLH
jgi:hypothetical protein